MKGYTVNDVLLKAFIDKWGMPPIMGGADDDDNDGGDDDNKDGDDKNDGDDKGKEKTYKFGGKELTADQAFEMLKDSFNDEQSAKAILKNPDKLAKFFNENYANNDGADDDDKSKSGDADQEAQDAEAIKQLKRLGFMTQDEYEHKRAKDAEIDNAHRIADELEEEYDGSDGKPVFDRREIWQFIQKGGLSADGMEPGAASKPLFRKAYNTLHAKALKTLADEKNDGDDPPNTERKSGKKVPKDKKMPRISFEGDDEDSISVDQAAQMMEEQGEFDD